uniref:Retrotransposon gag domain-containing protein n=1 Tax=Tanacetum cinerariifolium TaxID=118510 RepID=A0A6L2KSM6_TANCI|nr:hypothetical protein [Tanacetum cinerariifolium]
MTYASLSKQSYEKRSRSSFTVAVVQAIADLLPTLTARITDEIRQNENNENNGNRRNSRRVNTGGSGNDGDAQPTDIHVWLERFQKEKPQTFSSASTPVEAENWIAHIEKIFEVLGCDDQFKARLATYKLEGDAHSWWRAYKQAKEGDAYVATLSWNDFRDIFFLQYFPYSEKEWCEREYKSFCQLPEETSTDFMKRFLRLTGFLGAKGGTQEEQAKHFKWGLNDFVLERILNTELTDVAQVANVARNIEIFRGQPKNEGDNKRDRDGHRIRPSETPSHGSNPRADDRRDSNRYGKRGRWRKACHKATGACFECGEVASSAQGKVSSIPTIQSWGGSISPDSFLPSILLLVVIVVAVVIVVVAVIMIVVVEGWMNEFHQDKASSVRVPIANFTLQSSVQLLRENTDSVRLNQRMSPTAPSVPLKLKAFAMLAACASRAIATLSATSFLMIA